MSRQNTMMLLTPDSILMAQPLLLAIEQRRFVTGVRIAAESANFFYNRLYAALDAWGDLPDATSKSEEHLALFALAWSVIDNGRRFHRLLWKFPELADFPATKKFVDRWSLHLKKMRDAMQHQDLDYAKPMQDNYVHGSIFWIDSRKRISNGEIISHFVMAGPQANNKLEDFTVPKPVPVDTLDNIHSLTLSTAGSSIDIDDLITDIRATLLELEKFAEQTWQAVRLDPKNASDERQARLLLKVQNDVYHSVTYTLTNDQASKPDN